MIALLSGWLTFNLALSAAVALIVLFRATGLLERIRAADEVKIHYFLLALLAALSVMRLALPSAPLFEPVAKVWSAPSRTHFEESYESAAELGYVAVGGQADVFRTDAAMERSLSIAVALVVLGFLFKIGRDVASLVRWSRRSFQVRKIGRTILFVNERARAPFSFWLPGRNFVVLPLHLLADGGKARMAVAHEVQHHRQGDTRWAFALAALGGICFLNPLFHVWYRRISEVQEFACDEALVDQGRVDSRAYARLLVETAETASNRVNHPACATGMASSRGGKQLHRRIRKMLTPTKPGKRSIATAFAGLLTILTVGASFAGGDLIQDRRVTREQALAMAQTARAQSSSQSSEFPIVVNDLVLKWLNYFIGTPEGRAHFKGALDRMPEYQKMIEAKIDVYRLPRELLAVALVESGFNNRLPNPQRPQWGAGIWMFIAETARNFGLRVDSTVDERLNVEAETDAAMRYLAGLEHRFRDWNLALLSYNSGEARVQKWMDANGTRDAWKLIRLGHENDRGYLPKVMAAVLIMKNPDVLR